MTGKILPFRRDEMNTTEMKKFWVTMRPKTRGNGTPIELKLESPTAQQALYDAMQTVGLSKQEDFNYLEMLHEVNEGTYRVAYFDQTRSFSSNFEISLPVKRSPLSPPPILTAAESKKEVVVEKEEGYKEVNFEISAD